MNVRRTYRRRASTGGANHSCAVESCSLSSNRRGSYCPKHQNEYAPAKASESGSGEEEKPAYFVCLNACQGQVVNGFCERHNIAARAKAIADASTPRKISEGGKLGPLRSNFAKNRTLSQGKLPTASQLMKADSLGALPTFNEPRKPGGPSARQRAPSIVAMTKATKQGEETLERFLEAIHAISGELEAHKVAD